MAGADPGFDSDGFRQAIEFAMNMGLPQDEGERATFYFKTTKSYPAGTALDLDGNPLDPSVQAEPVASTNPVQVPVAVEFMPAVPEERPVGNFKPTKAVITVLDQYWPQVQNAVELELGGDRYVISYVEPPIGLFDVTVYRMACFARNET